MPDRYPKDELKEALRAIVSTIQKSAKVRLKLKEGAVQHILLLRRIKAIELAAALVEREISAQS